MGGVGGGEGCELTQNMNYIVSNLFMDTPILYAYIIIGS